MSKATIVAEIGINHGGDLDTALQLIDISYQSNADIVKFQKRCVEQAVPKSEWNKPKKTPWGTTEPYIEYKRKIEFEKREYDEISRYCKQIGIPFAVSVWDIPSLEFILRYDIPFIKIPSAHLSNYKLISAVVNTGIPVVLSTGMSTLQEVDTAVNLFPRNYDLTLMHCHAAYPSPAEETNLKVIETLRERYNRPVGFSSHSVSPFVPIAAMWRYNACMIEAHITHDRSAPGSDMAASLEQDGLALIARERDRLAIIDGDGTKRLYESELAKRRTLRGS